MGGCCSSSEVESTHEFRKRKNLNTDEFDGPIKGRSCTDVQYLVLFVLFIIVWIGLVVYAISKGDIRRIIVGYDDCGYICGINNPPANTSFLNIDCSNRDLTSKPYMLIYPEKEWKEHKRTCVKNCKETGLPGEYRPYFQRCYPKGEVNLVNLIKGVDFQLFFEKAAEDLSLCRNEIIHLCVFALGLSIFMILLFRYFAGLLVWFVLICVVVVSVGVSIYFWVLWNDVKHDGTAAAGENRASTYFIYAVLATLTTIVILLILFGMRKNIHLVAHLFYEAGKAVQAMPCIMLQPFLTFVAIAVTLFLCVYCFIWIESAGIAQKKLNENRITFKKDEVLQFARGFNIVGAFWVVQFLIGCQHMIIAGAVATWFFTRKKSTLSVPILKSYGNLAWYHLGTVALGALLIAIVQIIRAIFSTMKSMVKDPKNDVTRAIYKGFSCCLYCLEKILVFLTRNAYIEVAIFGDNLWTSGKRAFHVLVNNSLRVIAINSVGDFVLFLGKALVVACSVFIGVRILQEKEGLNYIGVPLTIIGVFAYLVSHAFMTTFEMIIDTIFICFCEDCELNDGQERPYFMSKGLMEFVEKSQKVLKVGDATTEPRSQTARWLPED